MTWFLYGEVLCAKCRRKMQGEWRRIKRLGMDIHTLYEYNGFSREQLLKFKDHQDQWLNKIFLSPYLTYFYFNFFNYVIVYVPSHKEKIMERGYIPNQLILETQHLTVIHHVFKKQINHKQSKMSRDKRHQIKHVITLEKIDAIKNRNVLLFDDLCTTGHSLKACYDLIEPHAKSIKVVALFHHEI